MKIVVMIFVIVMVEELLIGKAEGDREGMGVERLLPEIVIGETLRVFEIFQLICREVFHVQSP
jgi:hypothetical protein